MASKLNFRARTLDASKPMSIYHIEDLPELADLNAINRSVPVMPSGMEKEEEGEKHLQDILVSQEQALITAHISNSPNHKKEHTGGNNPNQANLLVIPTPEVYVASDFDDIYRGMYKGQYRAPKNYIHVQPFAVDQDQPDYDLDEEDQKFLNSLRDDKKFEVTSITLEDMLDRLEKNSGHNAVSSKEAKLLLKEDDDLILAVYDYWLEKRLRLKQPLIPVVKSDKRDASSATSNSGTTGANSNPYIAFRRRTEKMQTRKNRKNDEVSYEKMLKLRRDLHRSVTLLEMVKRREKSKKENLNLVRDIFEKRFQCNDWDGRIISEVLAKRQQPRVLQQQYDLKMSQNWVNQIRQPHQVHPGAQKRSYTKKKRHKSRQGGSNLPRSNGPEFGTLQSSDDERSMSTIASRSDVEEEEVEGPYTFKRKKNVQYLAPLVDEHGFDMPGGWPWDPPEEGGRGEAKYKYSLASLSTPKPRCIGMVRRRVGRGGRINLDRAFGSGDDFWRSLDMTIINGCGRGTSSSAIQQQDDPMEGPSTHIENPFVDWPHYRPVTPPMCQEDDDWDPYKARLPENLLPSGVGLPTQPIKVTGSQRGRLSMRPVAVDNLLAQNAASAVVSSDMMDIFKS